jgi:hypothetical protein
VVVVGGAHPHDARLGDELLARRPQPGGQPARPARHADDFENRRGFTYTVLDPATADVIGCVYIYPDDSEQHDARVLSWVRASRPELDVQLWRAITDWLTDEWPFERVAYAERGDRA